MTLNLAAYHFVPIEDPQALASRLQARAEAMALLGTALVAGEGVNLFLAGAPHNVEGFVSWLRNDPRFSGMRVKLSESESPPFAKLKVKVKPEIVSFRHQNASPLDVRAPSVAPATLARWISRGSDDEGRPLLLLDTRNREEVGYGTFAGAMTLPIDNFVDLPRALAARRDELAGKTVVGFCTGGIRCEKAALWMRAQGMDNVLQLDGGILGYFEEVGGMHYEGHCFVFDERVALDPELRPLAEAAA